MFLAPTWIISKCEPNSCNCSIDITSQTIGNPVSAFAFFISSIPAIPIPWNAYGDVLGLTTPPLYIFAPAFFTALAIVITCSSFSTAHGPAIITRVSPPISRSPILTIVFSGLNFLLALL